MWPTRGPRLVTGLRSFGADNKVGDVSGWAAPSRDGLGSGRRGELWSSFGDDVEPRVQSRGRPLKQARVGVEHLLRVVKEAFLQPRDPT